MRLRQLDTLRAVAVLRVIGGQYPVVKYLPRGGLTGVDLFFVPSALVLPQGRVPVEPVLPAFPIADATA
jgi:peptidoglycan/LPS O-acetylase OafA/YrhL